MKANSTSEIPRDEARALDALMDRVPFTSLPWIIGLMVCCASISLAGVVYLTTNVKAWDATRTAVSYVVIIAGGGAFCFWGMATRRARYRAKFKEMLSRKPLVRWRYTDAEWNAWLTYVRGLDYARRTPRTAILGGMTLAVLFGLLRAVFHKPESSFIAAFFINFGFVFSIALILAFICSRYWKTLCRGWERGPSETRVFEDGVFFHHRFIDWRDALEKAVLVEVDTADSPIATLVVSTEYQGDGLAPQIPFMAPIPHDQVEQANELAALLTRNIEVEEEVKEIEEG